MPKLRSLTFLSVAALALPMSLGCAGLLGPDTTTVVEQDGFEAYQGLKYSTWVMRESSNFRIVHDHEGVPKRSWGGKTARDGVVTGFAGDTWTWNFQDERVLNATRLDTCHVGFTGVFDGNHKIRAATRTWPLCDTATCTYDDLPFTIWEIDGFGVRRTFTIDHESQVTAWFMDEPGTASRTSTGMRLAWPDWSIDLERLNKCTYAAHKKLPVAEQAATWRVTRAWPKCGCP